MGREPLPPAKPSLRFCKPAAFGVKFRDHLAADKCEAGDMLAEVALTKYSWRAMPPCAEHGLLASVEPSWRRDTRGVRFGPHSCRS